MSEPDQNIPAETQAAGAEQSAPSDADVARARKREEFIRRMEKGRADAKAKGKSGKGAKASTAIVDAPKPEKPDPASLLDGCKLLVRVFWWIGRLGARIAGGKLADLDDAELEAGAKEALTICRRFPGATVVLGFFGFPEWFFRQAAAKFQPKPKQAQVVQLAPKEKAG